MISHRCVISPSMSFHLYITYYLKAAALLLTVLERQ
jgi:hypothetical protein